MITLVNPIICYNFQDFTFNQTTLDKFFEEMKFRFFSNKIINFLK